MRNVLVASAPAPSRTAELGWFYKQGGSRKTWRRRWAVLDGASLLYYTDESKVFRKGSLPIAGGLVEACLVSSRDSPKAFGACKGFEITTPTSKRVFLAFPCQSSDIQSWIDRIQAAADGSSQGLATTALQGAQAEIGRLHGLLDTLAEEKRELLARTEELLARTDELATQNKQLDARNTKLEKAPQQPEALVVPPAPALPLMPKMGSSRLLEARIDALDAELARESAARQKLLEANVALRLNEEAQLLQIASLESQLSQQASAASKARPLLSAPPCSQPAQDSPGEAMTARTAVSKLRAQFEK